MGSAIRHAKRPSLGRPTSFGKSGRFDAFLLFMEYLLYLLLINLSLVGGWHLRMRLHSGLLSERDNSDLGG